MKGRRPKPSYLKIIEGNRGKRRLNDAEPRPAPAPLAAPAWLCASAKGAWDQYAPELQRIGVLTLIDVPAFGALCTLAADVATEDDAVRRTGALIKSARGRPMANPFLRLRDKHLELLLRYSENFGMTPSARSRVRVTAEPDDDSPAAKYLTR